jgi:hypothetical protein
MYDADIQSMDAAAKGRSWMAPQVSTGLFMTPYNINPDGVLHDVTQMIQNSRLKADSDYMNAMSSVEVENKIILLIN